MKNWRTPFTGSSPAGRRRFLRGLQQPPSEAGAGGDVIKVGEFASLTGNEATFGQSSHEGTRWRWTTSTPPAACSAKKSS